MKAFKHIIFYLLIFLMLLPALQQTFHLFKERPLDGDFVLAEQPVLTRSSWNSMEFQQKFNSWLEEHIGFRNFFVRLQNQIDFSLYRKANAEGVVVGKKDYLYEKDYIRAYLGGDFVGQKFINEKLNRVKYVQDYLRDSLGIYLIIVFEPGKASFFPEFIPDKYYTGQKSITNYEYYTSRAKETGINYSDLNRYFEELKPGAAYPLFPKYGTHWSVYGMSFAADSLVKLIQGTLHEDLPEMVIGTPEISRRPRDTDYDVGKTMNLLFYLPSYDLAYPSFTFRDDPGKARPMVLTVADSYYWNIFNTGLPKHLFANEAFWYFNAKVYPDTYYKPKSVDDLDIRQEIEKQKVIFLMVTERFLYKFDWGFIDRVYELYTPSWLKDPVYENVNKIVRYSPWFDDVIVKAQKNGISLEQQLYADAEYVLETDNKTEYLVWKGPEYYEHKIRSDSSWLANVSRKAGEKGISMEQMLAIDIDYVFKTEEPGLYEIYYGIRAMEERIRHDSALMESIRKEAEKYHSNQELMIRLKAEMIYEEEQVMQTEKAIHSDPKWLQDVAAKAVQNHVSLDEMIRRDAKYVYDQKRRKPAKGG